MTLYIYNALSKRIRCYIASLEGNELPNPQVRWHLKSGSVIQVLLLFTVLAGLCFQTDQANSRKSRHVLRCISQCYRKFTATYYKPCMIPVLSPCYILSY